MSLADIIDLPARRRRLVPPGPPRAPDDISNWTVLRTIRKNALGMWSQRAYEDEIIQSRFLGTNSFVLNSADAIRHVLVDNYENYTRTPPTFRVLRPLLGDGLVIAEGRAWKHQRRTLAPAFTPRAVTPLLPHMVAVIDEMITQLVTAGEQPVDLWEAMHWMTLEIAGRTMFSFELGRRGAELRELLMDYGLRLTRLHLLDLVLPRTWPSPRDWARARFRRRWTAFIGELMAERRAAGKNHGAPPRDLFDLLDTARDPETGEAFTDQQLGDEVATMMIAGHETTATTLFWSLYLLALDPATQQELAAEIQLALQGAGAAGGIELERLRLTRAVIDETVRLYPPAYLIARQAKAPDVIAGLPVQRHDVMLIAPWLLHRHEKLWRDPNAFIPQRFLPSAAPPEKFAYLPFGAGPRVCIGAHFALVEATLALAKLIGAFRVELIDREPVLPVGVVTTQPDHAPRFRLTRR